MAVNIVKDYLKGTSGCGIFSGYPDISKRDKWDNLPSELKSALIQRGEESVREPWSELLISDFREFSKTGNRVRFEDKYFPRRRKLNSLVMAECAENKGRFVDDILDGLYLILEESTWCLPPHNSYVRDGKQEPVPDVTRPIIDLFDAESGAEVAFCEYLLRPVFEKISPFIGKYVNERLEERIFRPYLNEHFWWMGDGKEAMCNWTPWCTQNVLICALTRPLDYFDEKTRRLFTEKAAESCDFFLDEYGEDGCCSEGAQYYSHAALTLFGCLELIGGATDDSFYGIYSERLIRNVADFIVKMHVCGDTYINFADCSAHPGRRGAREFLFGKRTCDEALMGFAAKDFREEGDEDKLISSEINLFYHVQQAFAYEEMEQFPETKAKCEDSWFESTGLMVTRDDVYTLAAKAGNNADSHNHNDVGSYTIYKNGQPFVIDLGVGTYTEKTFSDRRYEIWTMQSKYHNLPTFGRSSAEIMQKPGKEFAAKGVVCKLGAGDPDRTKRAASRPEANGGALAMDIAPAYGDERIRSYKRTVTLKRGAEIVVSDKYDGDLDAYISIMTYEKPTVVQGAASATVGENMSPAVCENMAPDACENMAQVASEGAATDEELCGRPSLAVVTVGDLGTVTIAGGTVAEIEECPINDERLATSWRHSVYRIVVAMGAERELSMIFK